ncbi:hypothetical protein PDQ75_24960 [Bacillus cereus group sp. Bc015]|nr:hypothetical protein [Bacillus cereus group sp. Bc015]MDA2738407.1 hypothetical protein [Bacillus cereus group sp. Bc015]
MISVCHYCGCEVEDGWWCDEEKTMWIGIECGCDDNESITVDKA